MTVMADIRSVPDPSAYLCRWLQSRRLERRELYLEGPAEGDGDWDALRAAVRGMSLSILCCIPSAAPGSFLTMAQIQET